MRDLVAEVRERGINPTHHSDEEVRVMLLNIIQQCILESAALPFPKMWMDFIVAMTVEKLAETDKRERDC